MPLEKWSEDVVVARIGNDPQFSEDIAALEQAFGNHLRYAVLDFSSVTFLNSSNLAQLLRLRRATILASGRIILCSMSDELWGAFLVTSLDKVFEYSADVATSLASLQLTGSR